MTIIKHLLVFLILNIVLFTTNININSTKLPNKQQAAEYNKVPEHLSLFFGQGHELDCLTFCKFCIDHTLIKKKYDAVKLTSTFVSKKDLDIKIKELINELKDKKDESTLALFKQNTTKEEDVNKNSIFRVYNDYCFVYAKAFYA